MNRIYLIFIFLPTLLLSGCWDQTEIDEIAFILGVALDPAPENEEQASSTIDNIYRRKFSTTFQVAIPKLLSVGQNGGGGEGSQKPYYTVTATGMTNIFNIRSMAARRSRLPNFEHLEVIIINEKLARQGMVEHLIDLYIRDHEMRRRTLVLISKGEAKKLLDMTILMEDVSAMSIRKVSENYDRVLSMIKPMKLGDLSAKVINKESFLLQRIIPLGDNIKITGAAIFNPTTKMIGWLNEEETRGYNWLVGEASSGILQVEYGEEELFDFETQKMGTKTTYRRENEVDKFHVEIRVEGTFAESWLHELDINDEKIIRLLEREIEKKITKQTTETLRVAQHKFHSDFFGFGKKVKDKEYRYWKTIKENWDGKDGAFSRAEITVDVGVHLRHYMTQERTN